MQSSHLVECLINAAFHGGREGIYIWVWAIGYRDFPIPGHGLIYTWRCCLTATYKAHTLFSHLFGPPTPCIRNVYLTHPSANELAGIVGSSYIWKMGYGIWDGWDPSFKIPDRRSETAVVCSLRVQRIDSNSSSSSMH